MDVSLEFSPLDGRCQIEENTNNCDWFGRNCCYMQQARVYCELRITRQGQGHPSSHHWEKTPAQSHRHKATAHV